MAAGGSAGTSKCTPIDLSGRVAPLNGSRATEGASGDLASGQAVSDSLARAASSGSRAADVTVAAPGTQQQQSPPKASTPCPSTNGGAPVTNVATVSHPPASSSSSGGSGGGSSNSTGAANGNRLTERPSVVPLVLGRRAAAAQVTPASSAADVVAGTSSNGSSGHKVATQPRSPAPLYSWANSARDTVNSANQPAAQPSPQQQPARAESSDLVDLPIAEGAEGAHWSAHNQATWSGGPIRGQSAWSSGGNGCGVTRYGSLNRRTTQQQRVSSLRLANGRPAANNTPSEEELRSPRLRSGGSAACAYGYGYTYGLVSAGGLGEGRRVSSAAWKDELGASGRTFSDSLVTSLDHGEGESAFVADYITPEMNFKDGGRVHFSGDDVSLYGTPKEEAGPGPGPANMGGEPKPSFIRNQLQALFQPTDNKLAMKLFGSKKALMKERIRQKAAGHWIIHPCSNFRWVDVRFHPLVCTAHPRRPLAANKKKLREAANVRTDFVAQSISSISHLSTRSDALEARHYFSPADFL